MINLSFDLVTGVVRVSTPATVKVGADVPVRLTFTAAPGDVGSIELALGTDGASPEVLAYTDDFSEENPTTWRAVLDASDNRLVTFMNVKAATQVVAELVCIINGERQVAPNVAVTVQPKIIDGPETSEGGPNYLTDTQSDARYLPADPDGALHKFGRTAITLGVEEVEVAFPSIFASGVPCVPTPAIEAPEAEDNLFVVKIRAVSAAGFTAVLNGAAPASCFIHWHAFKV